MAAPHARLTAAVVGLAAVAGLAASLPATAAPVAGGTDARADATLTTLRLDRLDRGAGPAVPRIVGTSIVERDRVVEVDADEVLLLGTSAGDYVLAVHADGASAVERVSTGGSRTVVLDRVPASVELSADGTRLVSTRTRGRGRTVVTVRHATTGEVLGRRTFGVGASVLDADRRRVVVGQVAPARTVSWDVGADRVTRVAGRTGYAADISGDMLAVLTGPVPDGGCSVLTSLADPGRALWRSCDRAVAELSPDGRRVLTTGLFLDGPLTRIEVHTLRGRRVAAYRSTYAFGTLGWEDDRTVLATVQDRRGRSTLVRCERTDCERASDVVGP